MSGQRGFASDNNATVHPDVLAAIERANVGHALGYGHDGYSQAVLSRFSDHFGDDARAFPVFNGTGANIVSVRAACRPWQAVICADTSHLNVDECGAAEAIAGVKLLTVATEHGKLTPELVSSRIARVGDEHAVQPGLVSISQCTELGTIYTLAETAALAELAHAHGLLLHVDGARLSNAAAALGAGLHELTTDAGVDIVSFGGTKNGLLGADSVVALAPALVRGLDYLRKQSLQLASKMRFLVAQFDALLSDDLWLRCATHANVMATRLASLVEGVPGLTITRPVETNAVFATIPPETVEPLQARSAFYIWDERASEVRWMCSWDTTEEDVDAFAAAVREVLG